VKVVLALKHIITCQVYVSTYVYELLM